MSTSNDPQVEYTDPQSQMSDVGWKVLTDRGVPHGAQPGGGMDFWYLQPSATKLYREYLSRLYPGFHVPEAVGGLGIRYQPTLDGVPRLVLRPDTAYEHKDGKLQRRFTQQRTPQCQHPVVPWICPQVATALWSHAPMGDDMVRAPSTGELTPIAICEAPIKAWALTCAGIMSIGMGGIAAGVLDTTSPTTRLHPELLQYEWSGRTVHLIPDANVHTNWKIAFETAKIEHAFRLEGAEVRLVMLPRSLDKGGPDDYLVRFGGDALRQLVATAELAHPLEFASKPQEQLEDSLYFRAALEFGGEPLMCKVGKKLKLTMKAIRSIAEEPKKPVNEKSQFERGDQAELAEWLATQYTSMVGDRPVRPVYSEGSVYQYLPAYGIWQSIEDNELSKKLQKLSGSIVGDGRELLVSYGTVSGAIELFHSLIASEDFFASNPRTGIAMRNGFACVSAHGVEIVDHSPEHRQRQRCDFSYVPGQRPERFIESLQYAFRGDDDARQKIDALQEFVGVSRIGRAPRYEKAFILHGPRANDGKTTVLTIVERTFSADTVSKLSPWEMGDRFRLQELVGSLINLVDDDRTSLMTYAGLFKEMVTAKSPKPFERKGRDGEKFLPIAGHILACNTLPRADDSTYGWFRRQIVIQFNNQVEDSKRIRNLEDEIIAAEMQQIVCWTLDGAVRLMKQGEYTMPASSEEAINEWRKHSDNAFLFASEACREDDSDATKTTLEQLYLAYQQFCTRESIPEKNRLKKTTLGQRLEKYKHRTNTLRHYHLVISDSNAPPTAEQLQRDDEEMERLMADTGIPATAENTSTTTASEPYMFDSTVCGRPTDDGPCRSGGWVTCYRAPGGTVIACENCGAMRAATVDEISFLAGHHVEVRCVEAEGVSP